MSVVPVVAGCASGEQQLSVTCGDGRIQGVESCDGSDFGGLSCQTEGFEAGALACTSSCEIDMSDCTMLCGNNQIDGDEQCDNAQLDGATCESLGFDGGTLSCTDSCTVSTAACTLLSCGDGIITDPEDCDGAELGGATCESVGAYIGGTLACSQNCGFDVSGCTAARCGDGVISAGEMCDDNNEASADGCNVLCEVEEGWLCSGEPSTCEVACGNGDVDTGEDCDGTNLNGKTCMTEGFAGGDLSCDACSFDTSACLANICPNGTKEGPEACDGTDFGGDDCTTYGFAGGDLACTDTCEVNTDACVPSVCGNNNVEPGEQCDDNNTTAGDGCSDTCQWENTCTADQAITCGGSDSVGGPSGNDLNAYSCSSLNGTSEKIYSFTVPAGITSVTATVTCDDSSDDYDLYVLDACNGSACRDSGTESSCDTLTFSVSEGEVLYLVVEEYDAFWGGYTIDVDCS